MIAKTVVPGVYTIPLGMVNAFLIDDGELTLIDTGIPGSLNKILLAIEELGKRTTDLKHIVVTHLHADHTGSLAAVKKATGATVYMHPVDAETFLQGVVMRPVQPAPALVFKLAARLMRGRAPSMNVETTGIDCELSDGQSLDFAGGLQVIHAPGHAAGQVALLWPKQGGVLFAADAATHFMGLNWAPIYEDFEEGKRSLRKLAGLRFEAAVFGHGSAITREADRRFREKFGVA